jgi:hypothetical protein
MTVEVVDRMVADPDMNPDPAFFLIAVPDANSDPDPVFGSRVLMTKNW